MLMLGPVVCRKSARAAVAGDAAATASWRAEVTVDCAAHIGEGAAAATAQFVEGAVAVTALIVPFDAKR